MPDLDEIARDPNAIADFCGRRDVGVLNREPLETAPGGPIDAVILFGGCILAGAEVFVEVVRAAAPSCSLLVGGRGHTTEALRDTIAERTGWGDLASTSEAALFDRYLRERFGFSADLTEEESTNCGNNVANALATLRPIGVPVRRLLILQDATMQLRMDAGFRLDGPRGAGGELRDPPGPGRRG